MKSSTALIPVACALTLASCSSSKHDPTEHYYLITTNVTVSYWQTASAGLSKAARDIGVLAEMNGPDSYDPAAEHSAFQKVLGKNPTGILVSAAAANAVQGDIDAAIQRGIPVITIDSDAPASKRLLFVGTNNYQAGMMGGRLAAKLLNGRGNVVMYTMPGQPNLEERMHGYKDVFTENPGIHVARVIDIKGDPTIAFDSTVNVLKDDKAKVDGFICLEAIACKEVADVLDRNHVSGKTVIAMDTDKGTLQWIQKGMIAATIAQKPYTMAYFGVQLLDDLHHSKNPVPAGGPSDTFSPLPSFVDTGTTLIDKSNVDTFLKNSQTATSTQRT